MIKYEYLVFCTTMIMFIARVVCGIFLSIFDYDSASAWCIYSALFYLVCMMFFHIIKNISPKSNNAFILMVVNLYHNPIYFEKRYLIFYLFQLEVFLTALIISLDIGFGFGFDLYIFIFIAYFYLNLKHYSLVILVFPVIYFLIYSGIYLISTKVNGLAGESLIYFINIVFVCIVIFVIQRILEISKVIRCINDDNRNENISKLINYDSLTGTLSKYSFLDIMNLKYEYNSENTELNQAGAVLIDLYNLNHINEKYGNQLGNEVLKEFAYMLNKYSENYEKFIVRWSGSEFLILILNEDEAVIKKFVDVIALDVNRSRFSVKGIKLDLAIGYTHTLQFDFYIKPLIADVYKMLISERNYLMEEN